MRHLTLRVAWHDRAWDGSVYASSKNAFCLAFAIAFAKNAMTPMRMALLVDRGPR